MRQTIEATKMVGDATMTETPVVRQPEVKLQPMGIIRGTSEAITDMMLGDTLRFQFVIADTSGAVFFRQSLSHQIRFVLVPERKGRATQNGL